ncbi:MAG: hypothetical protein JO329_02970 [Planctomycetaceae bacterium]|nr:hypothetical protein [Planctomycetaceae bacterium]
MNRKRWWLALLYVLATVLVQGVHDHGGTDESAVAHHDPDCADLCRHVAGHPSPDLSHAPGHCLACQYRAEPHSCAPAPPLPGRPSVSAAAVSSLPLAPSRTLRRISCRAPPRA